MINLPISKIESAAMGMVSFEGVAQPRDLLRAPVSGEACCWWRCTVTKPSGKTTEILKQVSSTGFFYIEDNTGRMLIDPEYGGHIPCEITVSEVLPVIEPLMQEWGISTDADIFGQRLFTVTEERLSPGSPLYALGELVQSKIHLTGRKQRFLEYLRQIKRDPVAMAEADTNHDHIVDVQEWDAFRVKEEKRFLENELNHRDAESLILRAPKHGEYILSGGSRNDLNQRLKYEGAPSIVAGFAMMVAFGFVAEYIAMFQSLIILAVAAGLFVGFLLPLDDSGMQSR